MGRNSRVDCGSDAGAALPSGQLDDRFTTPNVSKAAATWRPRDTRHTGLDTRGSTSCATTTS